MIVVGGTACESLDYADTSRESRSEGQEKLGSDVRLASQNGNNLIPIIQEPAL